MSALHRTALVLAAAALAAGGCGSDEEGEPIPQDLAANIEGQLDNIRGQIDQGSLGACLDIKKPNQSFETLQADVRQVPERVDADVRDALEQSVDRLGELVDDECAAREPETETTPEETETVTIETVPEETVPEETVPEETEPEEEEEEPEAPPEGTPGEEPSGGGTPGGGGGGSGGVPAPGEGE